MWCIQLHTKLPLSAHPLFRSLALTHSLIFIVNKNKRTQTRRHQGFMTCIASSKRATTKFFTLGRALKALKWARAALMGSTRRRTFMPRSIATEMMENLNFYRLLNGFFFILSCSLFSLSTRHPARCLNEHLPQHVSLPPPSTLAIR